MRFVKTSLKTFIFAEHNSLLIKWFKIIIYIKTNTVEEIVKRHISLLWQNVASMVGSLYITLVNHACT